MEMKIGDREVVFVQTFIIPKNETLEFSFSPTHPDPYPTATYNKWTLNVKVKISRNEGDEISVEWTPDNRTKAFVMITLPAMVNRIGPAIMETPIKVGEVAGKKLGFYAAYSPSPAGSALVTLQFVYGGNYE